MIAPDSFKGTFRAAEVAAAVARGAERSGLPPDAIDRCPVADGGEGTLEALLLALGGETAGARVRDPLGRPVAAGFGLLEDGGTAVVEVAAASGLPLVAPGERDAEAASSYGTGELVVAAVRAGAEVVLVAAGGSATTDGGAGALAAIADGGGLRGAALVVLCDVTTPFEAAPRTFGPQKGADPAAVARLEARLAGLAAGWPRSPIGVPGTGAAGGLAGGLWAVHGARLEPGAAFVLDALGFDERAARAGLVVAGEGRVDATTLAGKAAGEVVRRARVLGARAVAVCGEDALGATALGAEQVLEAPTLAALEAAGEALASG